jgi:CheY-like chemotaxis protein
MIEDDLLVANIYSNRFRTEGYLVECARDGETGKDMVLALKPDLVVLDLILPKINGVEVLKFIRGHSELKAIPVIVFSNMYLANTVQEAWKAGATKCLSKIDCPPKQLVQVVNEMLAAAAPRPAPAAPAGPSAVALPPGYTALPPGHVPAPPPRLASALPEKVSDEAFEADLRRTFLEGGPQTVAALRGLLVAFGKGGNDAERLARLQELGRQVRLLCGNAGIVGMVSMARLAAALEALLKDLHEKPRNINASTLRTLAQTVDFLGALFEHGVSDQGSELALANTLVVDDQVISRRAVTHSLDRAGLKSVNVEDPQVALQLLAENQFDLVILDVEMPGMNGFELCGKLRALPQHASTPVVFVTGYTDFESRAKSIMSGGNDLIAKPFLFMELAVKALTHLLRRRLGLALPARPVPAPAPALPAPPPPAAPSRRVIRPKSLPLS